MIRTILHFYCILLLNKFTECINNFGLIDKNVGVEVILTFSFIKRKVTWSTINVSPNNPKNRKVKDIQYEFRIKREQKH